MADITNSSYEANISPISEVRSAEDETIIGAFPGGNEGISPISEVPSAEHETIIGAFPGRNEGVSPISEVPSTEDETILGAFPGRNEGMNLIMVLQPVGTEKVNPIPEDSSAWDETIIGVFPSGRESLINPIPEESSVENGPILVFPDGNDGTSENPGSHEYPIIENDPSFEESPCSTYKQPSQPDEETVIIPGVIIPETRKEPTQRARTRGPPGGTQ